MFSARFFLAAIAWQLCAAGLSAQQGVSLVINEKKTEGHFQRYFADSSFAALKGSLAFALQKNDKFAAALCLRQMGHICYLLGHYPQALDYHLQAGKLFREQGQPLLQAGNLDEIGAVFLHNKQPDLARQQYDEAFAIYRDLHYEPGMAHMHLKMGRLHVKEHHVDSSLYYYRLALDRYFRIHDEPGMASIYENIGSIYEDLKKYDSAYYYFGRSFVMNQQAGDTAASIDALNNMGDIFRKKGQYKEALQLTRNALALSLLTNERFHLGSAYRDMAKTHHLMGNNDSAYYYQQAGQRFITQTYSKENSTQLAILKTMYDVEKKNNEIGQLKASRKITVGIVVIVLLLLAMGILIISRQRLRIKNEQLLSSQERQTHQAQTALMEMQEQTLRQELDAKSKELSAYTLHIMQKNQFLEKIYRQLDDMLKDERRDQKKQLKQLQLQINQDFNHDQHWDEFHGIFDQVHQAFFQKLKEHCDTLTRSDLRLVALLKMNLPSTDIATLMGVSQDSVRVMRYRLRKKLRLLQGESLTMFIQSL